MKHGRGPGLQEFVKATVANVRDAIHRAACVFVKLRSQQSAERARIRSIPPNQRLEEAYERMVEERACLSITGLKAAAHIGGPEARAFLRSRGVPPQTGGLRKRSHPQSKETAQS